MENNQKELIEEIQKNENIEESSVNSQEELIDNVEESSLDPQEEVTENEEEIEIIEYTKEEIKKFKKRFFILLLSFLLSVLIYFVSKTFDPFKGVEVGTRFEELNLGRAINIVMILSIFITLTGSVLLVLNTIEIKTYIKKRVISKILDILDWFSILPICIAAATFCFSFLFTLTVVDGESMEPNYYNNEELFLLYTSKIDRFDVVVVDVSKKYGVLFERLFIKRVIGLPGEHIEYIEETVNGKTVTNLYVDGVLVEETFYSDLEKTRYLTYTDSVKDFDTEKVYGLNGLELIYQNGKVVIPNDYYLVLGDNRMNSTDSRTIGLIHKDDIIGEIKFKLTKKYN